MVVRITDPSENVKALVEVNERWRDVVRELDNQRHDDLREAETRRVDQLAALKQLYDNQTATLLASQVKEVKTDLQVELRGLNQFRYESSGKGIGFTSLGGWVVAGITILIAAAAYFKG
jgi:hypothetical protein